MRQGIQKKLFLRQVRKLQRAAKIIIPGQTLFRLSRFISLFLLITILGMGTAGTFFISQKINPIDWMADQAFDFIYGPDFGSSVAEIIGTPLPRKDFVNVPVMQNPLPPTPEAKEKIAQNPPKLKTTKSIAGATKTNADGSKTVTVAESDINQEDLNRAAASQSRPSTPMQVVINDETGKNSSMIELLRQYLNSTLKWGNEISALKEIDIKEVGDTGWNGQYSGSYTVDPNGAVISAYGFIILNTSYEKDTDISLDYLKLTLSHEYGHHYSLYHKWVDANLPAGTRFPDSYYAVRPLSKSATRTDCSVDWSTCEPEIVAEDYSYLYSGYGYHAMAAAFGYPSDPGTKNWFGNITAEMKGEANYSTAIMPANSPPTLTITSPASSADITDKFLFAVTVADDRGIAKVIFSRDGQVLATLEKSPYEIIVDISALEDGIFTFKARADDIAGSTIEKSFSLQINRSSGNKSNEQVAANSNNPLAGGTSGDVTIDNIQPSVTFTSPSDSPHAWAENSLTINISATDNVAVTRLELYINDQLVATEDSAFLSRLWRNQGVPAGNYTLKARANDAAGNTGENSVIVIKS